jgi:N,N'-diacetyllegionaminate synthase
MNKVFIVAEIGNNHEGSFANAKKLIYAAKKTGVDAVKFQTFKTENYVNRKEKKRFKKLKKFELTGNEFFKLYEIAKKNKLKFISTPFDIESANFLGSFVDFFKISSGDNNFYQLIETVLSYKKPTIISTGLLNYKEIKNLVKFVKEQKFPLKKLTLLHCVSAYPASDFEANLKSIEFLKKKLPVKIGYSDHTLGTLASVIATSYGAKVIEKHFTLDKKFSNFRDHEISADKNEMKKLVVDVNRAYSMLGKFNKEISKSEKKNKNLMRRSIYAKKDLNKNYRVSIDDIKITRPFVKTEPQDVNKILNKKLKKNVYKNEELKV